MLTQERLKECLDYNPETGVFTRKQLLRPSCKRNPGYKGPAGYITISIDNTIYYAHRLAWLFVYGTLPKLIDHIDRDKSNNRISNLREASRTENILNSSVRSDNKVGNVGICFDKRGYYRVTFMGKHIGYYLSKEVAIESYNLRRNYYEQQQAANKTAPQTRS